MNDQTSTGDTSDMIDILGKIVSHEIEVCENYLDDEIRPVLSENWDYYQRKLPAKDTTGMSFVDNTCQASVKHFVAAAKDAFVSGDLLEIVPDKGANAATIAVASEMLNDILDRENNRSTLYTSMFKDAAVAKVGILKPYVFEDEEVLEHPFEGVPEEQITMMSESLTNQGFEVLEEVITDEQVNDVSEQFAAMGLDIEVPVQRMVTGYITYKKIRKTIRIDAIPPENFLINSDAKDVRTARIVGHKNNVTISELIGMGFEYDDVAEVASYDEDDDVEGNEATRARGKMGQDSESETLDKSMQEVTLYEVYIRTSLSEVSDAEAEYDVAKLYQVFFCNDVVLSCEEASEAPYACGMIDPTPHSFWGESIVDQTKNIQRAKTGLVRQTLQYNSLQTAPRFMYRGVNERDLLSRVPGTGIKAEAADAMIQPVQLGAMSPVTGDIMGVMDQQREQGTGITFVGQGMIGEVLKAGGSSISASMVLSEQQMVVKDMIANMLHTGIITLCSIIYNMVRDGVDEIEVEVNGQVAMVRPQQHLPALREVRIKAPLGQSAKLEKAQAYNGLLMALSNPQMPVTTIKQVNLLAKIYELQDIKDVKDFLPTEEELGQVQQMQQMGQQLQELQMQNQQLQQVANEMAQKQMELAERQVIVSEKRAEVDATSKADKQALDEEKASAHMMERADLVEVREREQDMKELQTKHEIANPDQNLFRL